MRRRVATVMPQILPEHWSNLFSFLKAWSCVTNVPTVKALRPTLIPVILPNAQRRFVPRGQQSGSELDRSSPITL